MEAKTEYEENLDLPRLARLPRTYPPLRVLSTEFVHQAADVVAAARRVAEPVQESATKREPLDATALFTLISHARLQLATLERELARALYNQAAADRS